MSRTMLLKFAETQTLYISWRWRDRPAMVETARLAPEIVERLDEAMRGCLPEPIQKPDGSTETGEEAIERALTANRFSSPELSDDLGRALGNALIAAPLVSELMSARDRGERVRLRIQPSPRTARVPWPLLRIGPGATFLLDLVDIEMAPPAPINARSRAVRAPSANQTQQSKRDRIVAVIDPRVPGASPTSALGSVLGRPDPNDPLAQLLRHGPRLEPQVGGYTELARRRDIDRDWLREAARDAARLLYVGHATGGNDAQGGGAAALHLAGPGPHQPFTAVELVQEGWRLPPRCALIACGSGTDLRDPEPMGLTLAAVLCGAEVVTSTAWRLPTDAAIALYSPAPTSSTAPETAPDMTTAPTSAPTTATAAGASNGSSIPQPLRSLVLAVDAAHELTDPVAAMNEWQRERLAAWRGTGGNRIGGNGSSSGSLADSPVMWAGALTTVVR